MADPSTVLRSLPAVDIPPLVQLGLEYERRGASAPGPVAALTGEYRRRGLIGDAPGSPDTFDLSPQGQADRARRRFEQIDQQIGTPSETARNRYVELGMRDFLSQLQQATLRSADFVSQHGVQDQLTFDQRVKLYNSITPEAEAKQRERFGQEFDAKYNPEAEFLRRRQQAGDLLAQQYEDLEPAAPGIDPSARNQRKYRYVQEELARLGYTPPGAGRAGAVIDEQGISDWIAEQRQRNAPLVDRTWTPLQPAVAAGSGFVHSFQDTLSTVAGSVVLGGLASVFEKATGNDYGLRDLQQTTEHYWSLAAQENNLLGTSRQTGAKGAINRFAQTLGQVAGDMAQTLVAAGIGAGGAKLAGLNARMAKLTAQLTGMGFMGLKEGGGAYRGVYQSLREKGYAHDVANRRAILAGIGVGTLNALLEKVPLDEFLLANPKRLQRFTGSLRGFMAEGSTEAAQEVVNIFAEFESGATTGEPVVSWDNVKRVLYSGLAGGVVGAGAGALTGGQGVRADLEHAAMVERLMQQIDRAEQQGADLRQARGGNQTRLDEESEPAVEPPTPTSGGSGGRRDPQVIATPKQMASWYAKTFEDPGAAPAIEALASTAGERFRLVDIPIDLVSPNNVGAQGEVDPAKVQAIAKLNEQERSDLPPIIAIPGTDTPLTVADGTHRLLGLQQAGQVSTIKGYVPESIAQQIESGVIRPATAGSEGAADEASAAGSEAGVGEHTGEDAADTGQPSRPTEHVTPKRIESVDELADLAASIDPDPDVNADFYRGELANLQNPGPFVKVRIPLRLLDSNTPANPERAVSYMNQDAATAPPVIAGVRKDGSGNLEVIDGNNRAAAAALRGETTIVAYVPEADYKALREKEAQRGSEDQGAVETGQKPAKPTETPGGEREAGEGEEAGEQLGHPGDSRGREGGRQRGGAGRGAGVEQEAAPDSLADLLDVEVAAGGGERVPLRQLLLKAQGTRKQLQRLIRATAPAAELVAARDAVVAADQALEGAARGAGATRAQIGELILRASAAPSPPTGMNEVQFQRWYKQNVDAEATTATIMDAWRDYPGKKTPTAQREAKKPPEPQRQKLRPAGGMTVDAGFREALREGGQRSEEEVQQAVDRLEGPNTLTREDGTPPKTGEPITVEVFQGSGREDSAAVYGEGAEGPVFGPGRYSSPNRAEAAVFGPNVQKLTVTLDKPMVLTNTEQLHKLAGSPLPGTNQQRVPWLRDLRRKIEAAGHDGVVVLIPEADVDASGKSIKRLRELFGATQVIEFNPPEEEQRVSGQRVKPSGETGQLGDTKRARTFRQLAAGMDQQIEKATDPGQLIQVQAALEALGDAHANADVRLPAALAGVSTKAQVVDLVTHTKAPTITARSELVRGLLDAAQGRRGAPALREALNDVTLTDEGRLTLTPEQIAAIDAFADANKQVDAIQTARRGIKAEVAAGVRLAKADITPENFDAARAALLSMIETPAVEATPDEQVSQVEQEQVQPAEEPLEGTGAEQADEATESATEEVEGGEGEGGVRGSPMTSPRDFAASDGRTTDADPNAKPIPGADPPTTDQRFTGDLNPLDADAGRFRRTAGDRAKKIAASIARARARRDAGEWTDADNIYRIVEDAARRFNVGTPGKGRVQMLRRWAAGFWREDTEAIRLRKGSYVTTFFHELGHHLHKVMFSRAMRSRTNPATGQVEQVRAARGIAAADFPSAWRADLVALGKALYGDRQPPGSSYTTEGWAEVVRYLVVDPARLKAEAPTVYEGVVKTLTTHHPEAWLALLDARVRLLNATQIAIDDPVDQFVAHDGGASTFNFRNLWDGIRLRFFDRMQRLVTFKKDLGLEDLPADIDPHIAALRANGHISGDVKLATERGTFDPADPAKRPTGPSLVDILRPVRHNLREWQNYMVARRTIEKRGQGYAVLPEDARMGGNVTSSPRLRDYIARVEQVHPEFKEASEQFQQFNRWLVQDYAVYHGLVSAEAAQIIVEKNLEYITFRYKQTDDALQRKYGAKSSAGGFANQSSGIRRFREGHGEQLFPPLESFMASMQGIMSRAQLNSVSRLITGHFYRGTPGVGRWIDKIDRPAEAMKVTASQLGEEIRKQLGIGLTRDGSVVLPEYLRDLETEQLEQLFGSLIGLQGATFWKPGNQVNRDNREVTVLNGGKPEFFEVKDARLFDLLEGLGNPTNANLLIRLIGKPGRVLRAGATQYNPSFFMPNLLRDMNQALTMTDSELRNLPEQVRKRMIGMREAFMGGKYYDLFLASGADMSGIFGEYYDPRKGSIDLDRMFEQPKLLGLAKGDNRRAVIRDLIKLGPIDRLNRAFELSTRLGEFAVIYDKAIAEGKSERTAIAEAGQAAADISLDFQRGGTWSKQVNEVVVFFNAAMLGADKLGRFVRKSPAKAFGRIFALSIAPSLVSMLLNLDNDDYWSKSKGMRDRYWYFPTGTDDQGRHTYIKLPKPYGLGAFSILTERSFARLFGIDPETGEAGGDTGALDGTFQAIVNEFRPTLNIAGLQPLFEVMAGDRGYSFYRDSEIVSAADADLPFGEQGASRSSELARILGRWMGYPPAKIDYLIQGWLGGLGRDAVQVGIDPIIRAVDPDAKTGDPIEFDDWLVVRRFMAGQTRSGHEALTRFYDTLERLKRVQKGLKSREDQPDKYDAYERRHAAALAIYPEFTSAARRMSGLFGELRASYRNRDQYTADQLDQRVSELYDQIIEIARETHTIRRQAEQE